MDGLNPLQPAGVQSMTTTSTLSRGARQVLPKVAETAYNIHALGAGNIIEYVKSRELKEGKKEFFVTTSSDKSTKNRVQELQAKYPKARLTAEVSNFDSRTAYEGPNPKQTVGILAIKPKQFDAQESFPEDFTSEDTLIVSFMAGKTKEAIMKKLGISTEPLLAMPNLNAEVGKGTIGIVKSQDFANDPRQDAFIESLSKDNVIVGLYDQNELPIFTALAGSGPAFVLELIKRAEALIQNEFPDADANLVRQSAILLITDVGKERLNAEAVDPFARKKIESWIPKDTSPLAISDETKTSVSNDVNALVDGGQKAALNEPATTLTVNTALLSTLIGTPSLLSSKPTDMSIAALQQKVKSKRGTTEKGLLEETYRNTMLPNPAHPLNRAYIYILQEILDGDAVKYDNTSPMTAETAENTFTAAAQKAKNM